MLPVIIFQLSVLMYCMIHAITKELPTGTRGPQGQPANNVKLIVRMIGLGAAVTCAGIAFNESAQLANELNSLSGY